MQRLRRTRTAFWRLESDGPGCVTSSQLPTFSEPLTFVAHSRLAHGAPKAPEGGTDGPSRSRGLETPFSSPSPLEGEGRELLHAGGLGEGGRMRVTSNLAPGPGFPAPPSSEATQGRPRCLPEDGGAGATRRKSRVPPSGQQGDVRPGRGQLRGFQPSHLMNGSRFGAVWGPVLTHHCQLWQKARALRRPRFFIPKTEIMMITPQHGLDPAFDTVIVFPNPERQGRAVSWPPSRVRSQGLDSWSSAPSTPWGFPCSLGLSRPMNSSRWLWARQTFQHY